MEDQIFSHLFWGEVDLFFFVSLCESSMSLSRVLDLSLFWYSRVSEESEQSWQSSVDQGSSLTACEVKQAY